MIKRIIWTLPLLLQFGWVPLSAQPGTSAANPSPLVCNKQAYIPSLYSTISDAGEAIACIPDFQFQYGIWLSFEIARPGVLAFDLIPDRETDDLDFVLIRRGSHESIRCNAAGPSVTEQVWCAGITGMRGSDNPVMLGPGCPPSEESYVSAHPVKKGEHYLLFVHNFNGSDGFTISFQDALLAIPALIGEPVSVTPGEEGRLVVELSEDLAEYEPYWEFRHAQPARASGPGPHLVRTTSGEQFGWRMELIREDGCICELEDDAGMTDPSFSGSLRFWPNPAGERVYVDLRDLVQDTESIRTLLVLDLQGRMMLEHRVAFDMEVLLVEQLSPGAYILRVQPEGKYGLMVKM